jgi:cytochrome c oxidase subunit III
MVRNPQSHGTVQGPPPPPVDDGGWGGDGSDGRGASRRASFVGLLVLLASTTMLFGAFASAFLVRRGFGDDWQATPKPPILFVNTAILLASSVALETSRRSLARGNRPAFNRYWTVGTLLGFAFLAGQALAWRQLADVGVLVATNPSSSFFYLLTGAHAVHLLGGLTALSWVNYNALRFRLGPRKRTVADLSALFWHFLDALWLVLMLMFWFLG